MCEGNIETLVCLHSLPGAQACNSGMCPDGASNWQGFILQNDAQLAEPHWSGPWGRILICKIYVAYLLHLAYLAYEHY